MILHLDNVVTSLVDSNLIYVPGELHHLGHLNFSVDNFAFSSSENMNFYCSLFDNMSYYKDLGLGKIEGPSPCFSGEGLLKAHLYDFNKKPQYFCTNEELSVCPWWQFFETCTNYYKGSQYIINECLEFKKNLIINE